MVFAFLAPLQAGAETVQESTTGVTLDVQPDGTYSVTTGSVTTGSPPFVFRGSLEGMGAYQARG